MIGQTLRHYRIAEKIGEGGAIIYWFIVTLTAIVTLVELVPLGLRGRGVSRYFPFRSWSPRTWFRRTLSTAASVADALGDALIWPVSFLWARIEAVRRAKVLSTKHEWTLRAYTFLHPWLLPEAWILFAGVLIFFLFQSFFAGGFLRTLFLVVGISVTLKLAGWVISYNSFAFSLRRSAFRNPYVAFLRLAATTAGTLALALSGLRGPHQGETSLESLKVAARDLLLVGHLSYLLDLFDVRTFTSGFQRLLMNISTLSRYDWLAAMAGLTFEIAIFRGILGWRAFCRTEEDFRALAQLQLDVGQLEQAEEWLEKDHSGSYEADMVRIGVLVRRNQLNDAVERCRNLWCRYHRREPTRDEVFRSILVLADHYDLHTQRIRSLCQEWCSAPVADVSLLYVISDVQRTDSLLAVLQPFLAQAETSQSMLMSRAQILMREGAHEQAEKILSQRTLPTSVEEVLRRLLLLQTRVPSGPIVFLQELRRPFSWLDETGPFREVDSAALEVEFEKWCRQNLTLVEDWVAAAASRFERTVVGLHLFRTLKIAETLRVQRAEVESLFSRNLEHLVLDPALPIHSTKALVNLDGWLL